MARIRRFAALPKARRASSEDDSGIGSVGRRRAAPSRGRSLKRTPSPNTADDEGGVDEDSGDEGSGESTDESEDDAEEPPVLAPSGLAQRKHIRQTGLSISLSSTSIAPETESKKRKRGPENEEDEDREDRAAKSSETVKLASNATALLESFEDDDYDAVNFISDFEDEEALEQAEEAIMLTEGRVLPAALDEVSTEDNETPYFDEHYSRTKETHVPDASITRGDEPPPPHKTRVRGERRVHFLDDAIASESDLTPGAAEPDDRGGLESDQSYSLHQAGSQPITDTDWSGCLPADATVGLDEGDTTEDETMLPRTVHRPREILHGSPHIESHKAMRRRRFLSTLPPSPPRPVSSGPSLGSWVADPAKPIAVTGSSGTTLIYFPPRNAQSASAQPSNSPSEAQSPQVRTLAYASSDDGSDGSETESGENTTQLFQDALPAPAAERMLSHFHGGPASAGRPRGASRGSPTAGGLGFVQNVNIFDWDESDEEDLAGEKHLRIEDLIELDDSTTSEGDEAETTGDSETAQPAWPALHPSPRQAAGAKRDHHAARLSASPSKSTKVAMKLATMNASSKRLKTKH